MADVLVCFQDKPDFRDSIKVLLEFNFSDPESGPILDSALPNSVHEYVSPYIVKQYVFIKLFHMWDETQDLSSRCTAFTTMQLLMHWHQDREGKEPL